MLKISSKGIPVTRREVVRRINGSLRKDDPFHVLRRSRSLRAYRELGEYYVVDRIREFVVDRGIVLETEARRRQVLSDSEYLSD